MKYFADTVKNWPSQEEDGKWTTAKPVSFWTFRRFKEAWDVFFGEALAVYFRVK